MRARNGVRALVVALAVMNDACGRPTHAPAALDSSHEMCQTCRMIVSDPRMASQVIAPYEVPRFFDDLGCLSAFLKNTDAWPHDAVVFVADHRTRAWVRWDQAVYTRVETLSGAMGSHLIAHASAASRDADAEAAHGAPVEMRDVFPGGFLAGG